MLIVFSTPLYDFVLKGKGFKSINGNWKGDFVFTVNVQIPKKLTPEQRELITKLAQTMVHLLL